MYTTESRTTTQASRCNLEIVSDRERIEHVLLTSLSTNCVIVLCFRQIVLYSKCIILNAIEYTQSYMHVGVYSYADQESNFYLLQNENHTSVVCTSFRICAFANLDEYRFQ